MSVISRRSKKSNANIRAECQPYAVAQFDQHRRRNRRCVGRVEKALGFGVWRAIAPNRSQRLAATLSGFEFDRCVSARNRAHRLRRFG